MHHRYLHSPIIESTTTAPIDAKSQSPRRSDFHHCLFSLDKSSQLISLWSVSVLPKRACHTIHNPPNRHRHHHTPTLAVCMLRQTNKPKTPTKQYPKTENQHPLVWRGGGPGQDGPKGGGLAAGRWPAWRHVPATGALQVHHVFGFVHGPPRLCRKYYWCMLACTKTTNNTHTHNTHEWSEDTVVNERNILLGK